MSIEEALVTLATIGGGAALELFDREWERVVENIADPNTPATAKRELLIKIVVIPEEDRTTGDYSVAVSTKLPGIKPVNSQMFFGRKDGRAVAVTQNITHPSLFDTELNNITPMSLALVRRDDEEEGAS